MLDEPTIQTLGSAFQSEMGAAPGAHRLGANHLFVPAGLCARKVAVNPALDI